MPICHDLLVAIYCPGHGINYRVRMHPTTILNTALICEATCTACVSVTQPIWAFLYTKQACAEHVDSAIHCKGGLVAPSHTACPFSYKLRLS